MPALLAFAVAAALLLVLGLVWRALTAYKPAPVVDLPIAGAASVAVGDTLELLTWNVGYAGLGSDADFVADGGRHLRTRSRSNVERNLAAIVDRLRAADADVLLLQELARDTYATHRVDVLGRVQEALPGYQLAFTPMMRVSGLPLVGGLIVGQGTFARSGISRAVRHALASDRAFLGITIQKFNVVETRLPNSWVIFNVHLPAFDDGSLRRRHLMEVLRLMEAEYESGHFVVAGGDWNHRLAAASFDHTTKEKDKAWLRDLPTELIPAGWTWAVDPATPSNRTLDQPYRAGVNYRSVIDGFLVSPNVEVVSVETLDLEFANSDHNPVRARLRPIDSAPSLS